jgi:hypothetical protein
VFAQFPIPHFVANVHTVTASKVAYENEAAAGVVLQITLYSNTFIFVKRFSEI